MQLLLLFYVRRALETLGYFPPLAIYLDRNPVDQIKKTVESCFVCYRLYFLFNNFLFVINYTDPSSLLKFPMLLLHNSCLTVGCALSKLYQNITEHTIQYNKVKTIFG